jgi:hypothetical protein
MNGYSTGNHHMHEEITEPIVLVILKNACFLIHALLPRDLKAQGSEKSEVVPRAVKSARYHALLTKSSKTRPTKARDIPHFFRPKVRDIPSFLV